MWNPYPTGNGTQGKLVPEVLYRILSPSDAWNRDSVYRSFLREAQDRESRKMRGQHEIKTVVHDEVVTKLDGSREYMVTIVITKARGRQAAKSASFSADFQRAWPRLSDAMMHCRVTYKQPSNLTAIECGREVHDSGDEQPPAPVLRVGAKVQVRRTGYAYADEGTVTHLGPERVIVRLAGSLTSFSRKRYSFTVLS